MILFATDTSLEGATVEDKIDSVFGYIKSSNLIIRLYLVFLTLVAFLYLWYYFYEQKKPSIIRTFQGDDGYVEFCRLRANVAKNLNSRNINKEIYTTSHCNLFAKIDCAEEKYIEKIKGINAEYFLSIAKKLGKHHENVMMIVLLYYDELDQTSIECARDELGTGIALLNQGNATDKSDYKIYKLRKKLLTDYLVIEDHVFITKRKPESYRAPVSCIYMKDQAIADSYRNWLKSVSDSSTKDGYIDFNAIDDLLIL